MTVLPDNPAVLPMVHAAGLQARVSTLDGLTQISIGLDGLRPAQTPEEQTAPMRAGIGRQGQGRGPSTLHAS